MAGNMPIKPDTSCSSCRVRELCLSVGLKPADSARLSEIIPQRLKIKKNAALFHAGEPFRSLYAVRYGCFKTTISSEDGREQLTGFQMPGELLGIDAISRNRYACDAVALEDFDEAFVIMLVDFLDWFTLFISSNDDGCAMRICA